MILFNLLSLTLCGALSFVSISTHASSIEQLAESKEWKRLLHYSPTLFSEESEVDGTNFFLSKKGKSNLMDELMALKRELTSSKKIDNNHALCRFPARTKWLDEKLKLKLNLSKKAYMQCSEYIKFKKRMDVDSVSLVFSSYYLESPASAFGHTLLLFHRKNGDISSAKSRLLDMGINYSAQVTTENALLYAVMGIVGAFKGKYSAIPYFYKVREYNDFESRDLWNYKLNLSDKHIDRMLDHLWEVGNSYSDYLYFKENCSYNLLTLLEVANFDLDLRQDLPKLYTIPGHTVKIIEDQKSLVSEVSVDPSLRKRFSSYFDSLSIPEKELLLDVYKSKNLNLIEKNKIKDIALFLDTLTLYIDFLHSDEVLLGKGEISNWKKKVLIKRSKVKSNKRINVKVDMNEAPHLGHGPRRVSIGQNLSKNELKLGYRLAYHDIMDPSVGQPEFATIEFFDFEIANKEKKVVFEKIDLLEVQTLNPWTEYKKPFSLKAKVGFERNKLHCEDCLAFSLMGAGGSTFYKDKSFLIYSFLKTKYIDSKNFQEKNILELIPEIGSKITTKNFGVLFLSFESIYNTRLRQSTGNFKADYRYHINNKYSLKSELKQLGNEKELSVDYLFYY